MNNQPNYDMAMGFLQIIDVLLNLNQVSNDTLLEELQRQNKEYLEKIVGYNQSYAGLFQARMDYLESQLEKIVKQNEEIIGQNATIIAQGRNLYQMQEKIWGDINGNAEEILRRLDNGSQQRLP